MKPNKFNFYKTMFLFPLRKYSFTKKMMSKQINRKPTNKNFLCRFMFSKLEDFVPSYNLLKDLSRKQIEGEIATKLGIIYLSDTEKTSFSEIHGIFENEFRFFVSLIVEIKERKKNVIFLLITGSPYTFLSKDVLDAMGYECTSEEIIGKVNGHELLLSISPSTVAFEDEEIKFGEINILGADFLNKSKAVIYLNYLEEKGAIKFNEENSF